MTVFPFHRSSIDEEVCPGDAKQVGERHAQADRHHHFDQCDRDQDVDQVAHLSAEPVTCRGSGLTSQRRDATVW
jgi:hypothetical protein